MVERCQEADPDGVHLLAQDDEYEVRVGGRVALIGHNLGKELQVEAESHSVRCGSSNPDCFFE